jgi:hypothetical protein
MTQAAQQAPTSLRMEGPGMGLGLDTDEEVESYLEMARKGLIVRETACDKGMQDNFALRPDTTVELRPATA